MENVGSKEIIEVPKKTKKRLPFPNVAFEDALEIANAIWQCSSGQKVRRLTLFDHLGKTPDSGPSRNLITISSKYKLTSGGYQAEYLELTELGAVATNPDASLKNKLEARFELAINSIDYFKKLYEQFKDIKIPSEQVMRDYLNEQGLDKEDCAQCVQIFLLNCKYLNVLQLVAGAERILKYDHWLEKMGARSEDCTAHDIQPEVKDTQEIIQGTSEKQKEICFFIAPIGEETSEQRLHSDLFLNQIVEPALQEFNLKVVRADSINQAGLITKQIIEHLRTAKLVVADLSFHNPNVFYELAYRHTLNLPTIHIIRKADNIPFDINDFRTIVIDDTSIYTLVPQLETFRRQIATQAKNLLENQNEVKNPISIVNAKNN